MGGSGREVVVRGRQEWAPRLPRTTATLMAVLGLLLAVELSSAASVAGYAAALVLAAMAGTAVAAWRMWVHCTFDVRLGTGGLAGLILSGQVLVSSFGDPGGRAGQWHLDGIAVAAVSGIVLALAATAPVTDETRRHPYAL